MKKLLFAILALALALPVFAVEPTLPNTLPTVGGVKVQGPAYYLPRVKSMGTKGTFVCYSTVGHAGARFIVTTATSATAPPAATDYLMYYSDSTATFPLTDAIVVLFRADVPKVCMVGYSSATVKNGRALYF